MTKKDYELIASVFNERINKINELPQGRRVVGVGNELVLTASHLAAVLAEQDKRFKRDQFLKDCGVPVELRKPFRGTQFETGD